jgi:hypothetical protein
MYLCIYIYICELFLFFCIFHVHVRSQLIKKQQCTTVSKDKNNLEQEISSLSIQQNKDHAGCTKA